MRVVLDTNILIRCHPRSRAAAKQTLGKVLGRRHTLVLSNEMIAETIKVLRYPRFQALYQLTEAELYQYTQFLQKVSELVVLDPQYQAPLRDLTDLIVMQTAERGEADILCTRDRDFYDPAIVFFCAKRGIEVCDEFRLLEKL